jgi:diguanylate cyclase (GGDEF)-like protein
MNDDEGHAAAITQAFRVIHDVQAARPGAPEALAALAARASEEGWDDVVRACVFGEAVASWVTGVGDPTEPVARLIEKSAAAGDDVMLALALALRSDQGFSGGDLSGTAVYDQDLARAMVMLEQAEGRPCERISAHTACAIALGNRWLFELSDDQYETALCIGAAEPVGTLDFLLAPIRFNLAEQQVSWASKLYELGDEPGVAERWASWKQAVAGAGAYEMSEAWQVELEALGLVLRALAGDQSADDAKRLLSELKSSSARDGRAGGLLRLAIAIGRSADAADAADPAADAADEADADHDGGRRLGARATIEEAVAAISPTVHPFMYDLALFLGAKHEARPGSDSGLRYARRVVEEQWAKRDAALMAMRSQVVSVRIASERDLLSRHARLDDLTGIANRRALEEFLSDLMHRGVERCALVLFDVDGFKAVNDAHGHLAGDRLLVRIADILGRGIRSSDLAVRLGGDEFAVILSDTGPTAALYRAECLVRTFDQEALEATAGGLRARVSAGVAVGPPSGITEMWAAADAALYDAKAAGGHVVRLAPVVTS